MSNLAIKVDDLSKRYRLGGHEPYRRLGESISRAVLKPFRRPFMSNRASSRREILWALRDVSFTVNEGEVLGIVGANGAGKTTLLRVLAKITLPTRGRAEIYGRVGSLLEVGTGFHPELTGRENVYLNGAILGMTRREIANKYEEIVSFAQIEQFMETPVKHYSSGMRVRLAFSVAAHLDPEILFIDEVLAVGDAAFQRKCLGKMEDVANAGRTVLFVSHNMGAITGLCTRVLWCENGSIKRDGEPQEIAEAYLSEGYESDGRWEHPMDASCGTDVCVRSMQIAGPSGAPQPHVPFDEPVRIEITHEVRRPVQAMQLVLFLTDMAGNDVIVSSDRDDDPAPGAWEPGTYRSTCTIPASLLRPGRYVLSIVARTRGERLDEHRNVLGLEIAPIRFMMKTNRRGIITPILPWTVETVASAGGSGGAAPLMA